MLCSLICQSSVLAQDCSSAYAPQKLGPSLTIFYHSPEPDSPLTASDRSLINKTLPTSRTTSSASQYLLSPSPHPPEYSSPAHAPPLICFRCVLHPDPHCPSSANAPGLVRSSNAPYHLPPHALLPPFFCLTKPSSHLSTTHLHIVHCSGSHCTEAVWLVGLWVTSSVCTALNGDKWAVSVCNPPVWHVVGRLYGRLPPTASHGVVAGKLPVVFCFQTCCCVAGGRALHVYGPHVPRGLE